MPTKVVKSILILLLWVLCLGPLWIALLVAHITHPEGFWEKIVLLGGSIYLLAGFQILFLFLGVLGTIFILSIRTGDRFTF